MIDLNKKYTTGQGRIVSLWKYSSDGTMVLGTAEGPDGRDSMVLRWWSSQSGYCLNNADKAEILDLIELRAKGYVNVYLDDKGTPRTMHFSDKQQALAWKVIIGDGSMSVKRYRLVAHLEWEEGQGLEGQDK